MKIPITKPYLGREEEKAVVRVLRSGWLAQGQKVKEFEEAVASYVGAKYAVATTSCTTSLHLALVALGIEKGDEVIVPSYTFIATANAVLYCGARPVFVDVNIETYNLDPTKIEAKITRKTKAIIPVHQVGLPCDMDAILKIAARYNLFVIEDAACALGAEYKGKKIGSLNSNAACFSFHPRKAITTGEGGMIVSNDKDLIKKVRMLRNHGASISAFDRHKTGSMNLESYSYLGYNYRMTDIQAAVGIEQLKKLDKLIQKRRRLAAKYNSAFKDNEFIIIPQVPTYAKHIYQSYMIRIVSNLPKSRNQIMKELEDKGVSTRPGIMTIHNQPYYLKRFPKADLPVTEDLSQTAIILPIYPDMTEAQQQLTVDSLLSAI